MHYLNKHEVGQAFYPIPIHLQVAYTHLDYKKGLPNCGENTSQCLSLPIHSELSDENVDYVCNSILSFYKNQICNLGL